MTIRDLVTMSIGNLWRMKLRSFLTISGVVIAIAAFVAMLSFGAGMQERISEEFAKFGLLSVMQVYPEKAKEGETADSLAVLDDAAVERLSHIPGVELVFPYSDFDVKVTIDDTTLTSRAQALPTVAFTTRLFSQLEAGSYFASDSSDTILVTSQFLEDLGLDSASALVGKSAVLSVEVASIDSAIVTVIKSMGDRIQKQIRGFDRDSLWNIEFWKRIGRSELAAAMGYFSEGLMSHPEVVSDTFVVGGVLEGLRGHRTRMQPILVPSATARRFRSSGPSLNPRDMMSSLASGQALNFGTEGEAGPSYPQVTVNLSPTAAYQPIKDSVEAMGFRGYSLAEDFEEIRKFFRFFNLALSMVGLIALVTASLGIVNTMVMSITERRREIGVMMSLGADISDVRILFLFESGMIGFIGGVFGIIVGWIISRIASIVAQTIMAQQGVDQIELFALPWWLIAIALTFGILVSLIAGYYPAARAARIDPVQALRQE